jgi:D-alanyl-D-alanine carboxypeptidase
MGAAAPEAVMVQTLTRGAFLAIGLFIFAGVAQAQQYAALVMDARTGRTIHSQNADTPLHPASLTKMMTLYIVFDEIRRGRLSLDQKVTVSANAASEPPSKLGLRAGQQIEVRYLIRAAAIKSANDAATALGEAVAGSEAAFARRMTAYARAMGMQQTTFKNAHGLTAAGHVSTAREMAMLGRRLVYDFPQYYNIFSRNATSAGVQTVQNTNRRLLDAYPGADGIKTGYTRAAGFNLVSSAQRGDRRVIVALLGGRTSASRNAEVARLMDLGFAQMPRQARFVPLEPLHVQVADGGAPAAQAAAQTAALAEVAAAIPATRGSTSGVAAAPAAAAPEAAPATPSGSRLALATSGRPMPRALANGGIARDNASIAAAIAEVNAELAAAAAASTRSSPLLDAIVGRPLPRPETATTERTSEPAAAPSASAGSASTFAAAPPRPPAGDPAPIQVAEAGTGRTGGEDWGVQLGAFLATQHGGRRFGGCPDSLAWVSASFCKARSVSPGGMSSVMLHLPFQSPPRVPRPHRRSVNDRNF